MINFEKARELFRSLFAPYTEEVTMTMTADGISAPPGSIYDYNEDVGRAKFPNLWETASEKYLNKKKNVIYWDSQGKRQGTASGFDETFKQPRGCYMGLLGGTLAYTDDGKIDISKLFEPAFPPNKSGGFTYTDKNPPVYSPSTTTYRRLKLFDYELESLPISNFKPELSTSYICHCLIYEEDKDHEGTWIPRTQAVLNPSRAMMFEETLSNFPWAPVKLSGSSSDPVAAFPSESIDSNYTDSYISVEPNDENKLPNWMTQIHPIKYFGIYEHEYPQLDKEGNPEVPSYVGVLVAEKKTSADASGSDGSADASGSDGSADALEQQKLYIGYRTGENPGPVTQIFLFRKSQFYIYLEDKVDTNNYDADGQTTNMTGTNTVSQAVGTVIDAPSI